MKLTYFAAALLAASLTLTSPGRVAADAGDALVGGIIGGVIGGAIVNEGNKRRTTKRVYRAPSPVRAENREIQTSLNYFGFPAGSPDGVLGRNSRTAISQYQAHMGYSPTGRLSLYEKDFLITSYHRALAGGPVTLQQAASHPMGSRGLLYVYRDQAAGVLPQGQTTTAVATAPTVQPTAPVVTEVSTGNSAASALPTFMGSTGATSLASHCNTVSLLTNTNGGFTTAGTINDPNVVLNEQFCLARTYAIASGEELASSVQGTSAADIQSQCAAFGPVMKDYAASLSLKQHDAVLRDVSGFVLTTGIAPQQLAGTAKICLSVGYRTDNMDVAIGSALLLSALGEQVYGELMGHHLSQGFGAIQRRDLALEWYDQGLSALEAGQPAVFAPGQPERIVLLRMATIALGGKGLAGTMNAPVQPVSALPNLKITE